jgi:RNA polymerase subunit RPABC4/transcription elongation factor Spt4
MLDLKKCPRCREQTDLKNEVCPYCGHHFSEPESSTSRSPSYQQPQNRCPNCGASVPAGRPVCPVCRASLAQTGRSRTIFVVAGFVAAVLMLALFVFYLPSLPPGNTPPAPAQNVTPAPTMPQCIIAITGQKVSGNTIQLHLMEMTCVQGDISKLRVMVNGRDAWILDPRLGASGNYPGHAGPDSVVVVAVFSSGYEKTVLESTYS